MSPPSLLLTRRNRDKAQADTRIASLHDRDMLATPSSINHHCKPLAMRGSHDSGLIRYHEKSDDRFAYDHWDFWFFLLYDFMDWKDPFVFYFGLKLSFLFSCDLLYEYAFFCNYESWIQNTPWTALVTFNPVRPALLAACLEQQVFSEIVAWRWG